MKKMKKMEMTNRERLMAAFKHEKTDRVPWSPLVDEYFSGSLPDMGYPPMSNIDFGKLIGYDIMERHVNPYKWSINSNVTYHQQIRGSEAFTVYETPVGTISSVFKNSKTGGGITKFPISTLNDMKVYQYVIENSIVEPDYTKFSEVDNYIGDHGMATASIYETGITNMISRMMGLETMVYMKYDYPDEFDELVTAFHEFNKSILKITCQSPAQAIFSYEGTSTTTISADMYYNYSMPQDNDYADIVHSFGKFFIVHMCGKLTGFKDMISSGRMDGIDSLCPPAAGDVTLAEGLKYFPGKLLIGGLEPPALSSMTVKETERYVTDILEECRYSNCFILSTGDAAAYGTPVENIGKVLEIAKKYKK